jgi:hypothetical protein
MVNELPTPPTFSPRRKWVIACNLFVAVVAVLALAVMANYLGARHYLRFQWSGHGKMVLSPQTVRMLRSITNHVKVTVFFDAREERDAEVRSLTTALLKEYNYRNPRVVSKSVDPARQPAAAELVLATYKLTALKDRNFVVLDCDGRTKVIYQNELVDYQLDPVEGGRSQNYNKRMVNFKGEVLFTTALFNLAEPRQYKICFLQGHREHDPADSSNPHGYAKFAEVLREKASAQLEKLSLRGTNDVPADCQLLIVAGPRQRLDESELAKIEAYLRRGGRLFALLNNLALGGQSDLEKVLAKWGVLVGDKTILDPRNSPADNVLLTAKHYPHPIMSALASDSEANRVLLVLPRAVSKLQSVAPRPDAPKVDVLAASGEGGTEVSEFRNGVPYPNPYQDRQASFPLIVAVEDNIQGVSTDRGSTRMAVVGDSLCMDNELIDTPPAANHYFAALAANWLLERPQVLLQGLVPQPLKTYRLVMTNQQLQTVQWLLLGGLPGAVLLLGGLVWWRRRH